MKVSLIVLNYNGRHLLKDYFTSLFQQTYIPDEVILFDNCSIDGSIEFVQKKYPTVKIISENRFNTGAALGLNIASRYVSGEVLIFQSNDIRMDKRCIQVLVDTLEEDSKIGICTSVSLTYQKDKKTNSHLIENAGAEMDIIGFNWPLYNGKSLREIPQKKDVFCVYGTSIIIRAELFRILKGFDEKYFALNDDIDLSWRVRLLGYNVVCNANSYIYHRGHATLGTRYERATKRYWSERNCLRTLLKNYSFQSLCKYLPYYFLILTAEMLYHIRNLRFDLCLAIIRALGWNIFYIGDTLKKRFHIQQIRKIDDIGLLSLLHRGSLKFRFGR